MIQDKSLFCNSLMRACFFWSYSMFGQGLANLGLVFGFWDSLIEIKSTAFRS